MKISYKNFICNIGVSIISVFLIFLFLEISIRISLYFRDQRDFEEVMKNLPELKPDVPASLADIIKPSKYPGIIYELRPDIQANYMGVQVRTNSDGWRGNIYPMHKDKNTIRIVTIGDSHMFGWGVPEDKRYTDVMEGMLNSGYPDRRWEIINTAVPGYNTYMETETLQRKALIYKPDIVIMEYTANDLDLPNFICSGHMDYLDMKRLYLFDFVIKRSGLLSKGFQLYGAPLDVANKLRNESNPDKAPPKYKHMVGYENFLKTMERLKKIKETNDLEFVVLVTHDAPLDGMASRILKLCAHLSFHAVYRKQDISDLSLILSREDTHPSILEHRRIAKDIYSFMIKENIINKRIKKQ